MSRKMAESFLSAADPDDAGLPDRDTVTAVGNSQEGVDLLAPTQTRYYANVFPGESDPLPDEFSGLVRQLEASLNMRVFLLIQNGSSDFGNISHRLWHSFFERRYIFERDKPIAVLIESPGGIAQVAFRMASLIRKTCGSFTAVVPQYAKSAATLFSLGAREIMIGEHGELGPLDAQIFDPDREGRVSALDEVQSIERLHAAALEAVDQSMIAWVRRSGKKLDTLLPTACTFVTDMMRQLFEKIDTVHYTQTARDLKEAEEYAVRLLKPQHHDDEAKSIARHLVEKYPEHGFVIDAREATELGLNIVAPTPDQSRIIDALMPYMDTLTVVGYLEEV